MRARIETWWFAITQSLWFVPTLMTGGAVVLAIITPWIDQAVLGDSRSDIGWLFGGGTEGARGVLQAISGTMITVTALVFSLTVVALQLASSQLSPRILHTFMTDRATQVVMGSFIGTFTYALLVLRVVRAPLEETGGFVPSLSVTVAIGLAVGCVGLLIFFVNHVTNAMRASVVINRAASAARSLIDQIYPDDVDEATDRELPVTLPGQPAAVVRAEGSGYLQRVDIDALGRLAERDELTIRPDPAVGSFVLPGSTLATVWPAEAVDEDVDRAIRGAFGLGVERTLQADVAFGLQQLSDIAVKALSPGINDPTTARICIDRLSELLVLLGRRAPADTVLRGEDGQVLVVLSPPGFADLVNEAFGEIRHYGSNDPVVATYMVAMLGRIAELVPAERRQPLVEQAELLLRSMRSNPMEAPERAEVERAADWIT